MTSPLYAAAIEPLPRRLLAWAAVALLYVGGELVGLSWAQWGNASPIWPATGIGVAAVFYLGPRIWPAILAGALAGNLLMHAGPLPSLAAALGSTAEAVLGWHVYQRLNAGEAPLASPRATFHYVLAAALIGPLASASLGVTSLALAGDISWALYGRVWMTWWLANVSGAIVVGAALLAWWRGAGAGEWRGNPAEFIGVLLATALAAYLAFAAAGAGGGAYPLDFLPLPALLWATLRFGLRGVSLNLLLLAAWAVWASLHGLGVFANWPGMTGYWLLLLYILAGALPLLAVAAVAREREARRRALAGARDLLVGELAQRTQECHVARAQLAEARARLDLVTAAAPIVFWAADAFGRVTLARGPGLEAAAQRLNQAGGLAADDLFAEEPALLEHIRQALAGRSVQGQLRLGGRLLRVRGEPVRDGEGNRAGAMGVGFEMGSAD